MSAGVVEQRTYDAYCSDCQWYSEGFDDEDECWATADAHNIAVHGVSEGSPA